MVSQSSSSNSSQTDSMAQWYLIASKPKQEFRAVDNLAAQGISVVCPKVKVEKIVRGKRKLVEEALFAGYLFIKLSTDDPLWAKIRSTRGVRDWIKFGSDFARLPETIVEQLLVNENSEAAEIIISRFTKGDSVRILEGPFTGLKGIFEKEDGEMRSMILIDFLGKQNRIRVNPEQIISD